MARTWLVTGAASGLGLRIAEAAAGRGDHVVATVRQVEDAERLRSLGAGIEPVLADVTDPASLTRAVEAAEAMSGAVDILVNNAGRGFTAAIEEASLDEIRSVFEVNVLGAISAIQAVLPGMRRRLSGRIINISSISGFQPWSGTGIYCASKFALEGIGQTLAQEVAGFGISVTNVQPGGLRTDFSGRSLGHAARRIEDYSDSAHIAPRALAKVHGGENGDPVKAARAILLVADCEKPPMNLLLGADAIEMANRRMGALLGDMGRWAQVGTMIGFTPEA